ncbi:MAG: bestrophin family ion channel [Bacteroidota bacterium]
MINYKTNGNWFRDIGHLTKSWTMVKIIRSVLAFGVYTTIICVGLEQLGWADKMYLNTSIYSLLGVILSIFLVFRTNTAYDRWWEARKQWGALVNNTRNLAIYVDTMFPEKDKEVRHFMAKHISNFCIALVEHLRSGVHIKKLIYLHDKERADYQRKGHIPNYIAQMIFDRIASGHRQGEINEGDYINIKAQHQSLLDILGACERIKKTPIPFSYVVYLRIFIIIYAILLPFALVSSFHLTAIPLAMFIFFSLLGIQMMAEEIEDPFGLDCNDLPTGDIAHTIKGNVFEILEDRVGRVREVALYEKVH